MSTRSLRFRLTAFYAGLLTCLIGLFVMFVYVTLNQYLERNLRDSLANQAQTIGETLLREVAQNGDDYVIGEIDEHFAPTITGQFLRVTRRDGSFLYQSGIPHNAEFDPAAVSAQRPDSFKSWREEHLPNRGELRIYSLPFTDAVGDKYLIEAGAPHAQIERVLHGLLL